MMRVSVSQLRVISQRYSKESQSSSPVSEPRVYHMGVMGSRDPSQSVGPSNTSPLAVPEAELINYWHCSYAQHGDFPRYRRVQ
jgi:hypothetical protein